MTCTDFCTAAKCEELEAQIVNLTAELENLEVRFNNLLDVVNTHFQQEIPEAHNYQPEIELYTSEFENELYVELIFDGEAVFDSVLLPVTDLSDLDLTIESLPSTGHYEFTITAGGNSSTATQIVEYPEVDLYFETFYYGNSLELYLYGNGYTENVYADAYFELDELEVETEDTHVVSNLDVALTYAGGFLQVAVADGESSDSDSVEIRTNTDGGGGDSNVTCEQTIQDCCDALTALISGVSTKIDSVIIQNTEIKDEITIDITNTVNHNYECEFAVDDDNKLIPAYAESKVEEIEFTNKGLLGINQFLQIISGNLDRMHDDICKAIEPMNQILGRDLYKLCVDTSSIDRADYPEGEAGTSEYEAAIEEYVQTQFSQSKYGQYASSSPNDVLLSAPNNWIVPILVDFALIQARDNNQKLCSAAAEEIDVVSVLASPGVATNVDDPVLILHFVTFDNYPKRQRGSDFRPVQIPGAKDTYDWEIDFKDLVWSKGNQYGELELNEYKAKVSGWFLNKEAGEAYFDRVLTLTKGTEKNRRYSDLKVTRTDIAEISERPYRAFIEEVNAQNQPVCIAKYSPPPTA